MAQSPTMIGPYRVVRELGRGGMGVVWEVRHPGSPRPLALKQVLGEVADGDALLRFTREAELLARLRHPGVVAVHAFGSTEVGPYLVTDLVVGRDLKELARGGPLEPRRAAELVAGVAAAVQAVHAHGLLHRDLKPGNVIVQERDGRPVLLDFGLARELDGSSLTRSGALVGTPGFMAPEQVDGARDLDARADVYGLGAILFFLLAGRAPFEGSLVNIFARVLTSEPEWPRAAPAALVAIARKAMAKGRDARYPTAAALADDLLRWLAGERPLAADGVGRRLARGLAVLLGLAALVAVAGGAAWWLRREGAARGPADERPPPATDARPPPSPAEARGAPGPVESPDALRRRRLGAIEAARPGPERLAAWLALVALAPSFTAAERAAYEAELAPLREGPLLEERPPEGATHACVGLARGPDGLGLGIGWRSGHGGRWRPLDPPREPTEWDAAAPHEVGLRALAALPGGDGLVLIGGAFYLTSRAPGSERADRRWCPSDAPAREVDELHSVAVSPTGRYVAVGGEQSRAWVLDVATWAVAWALSPEEPDRLLVESLAWAPVGARLAVVRTRSGNGDGGVDVWDLHEGGRATRREVVPAGADPRPRCAAFDADGALVVGFDGGFVTRYRGADDEPERLLGGDTKGKDVVAVRVDGAGRPIVVTGVHGDEASGLLVTRDLPGARPLEHGAPGTCLVGRTGKGYHGLDVARDDTLVATGDRAGVARVWAWRLPTAGGSRRRSPRGPRSAAGARGAARGRRGASRSTAARCRSGRRTSPRAR